jgi:hypothetical protein
MNEIDLKVSKFTNISDFDFNGELGARYGGKDYFVAAGASIFVPAYAADHFATHLARAILIKGAPIRDGSDVKSASLPLWSEASIDTLKARMLSDTYTEDKAPIQNEDERLAARIADLNKVAKSDDLEGEEAVITGNASIYKDKQQVLEALKAAGIAHDPRLSKANLEALLN